MTATTKQATSSQGRLVAMGAILATTTAVLVAGAIVANLGGTPTSDSRPAAHAVDAAMPLSAPDYGERLLAAKRAGAVSAPDYGERLLERGRSPTRQD